MYQLSSALGANLIPIAIFVVAILLAKKSAAAAWILFAIGAILDILSLVGNARQIAVMNSYFGAQASSAFSSQVALNAGVFLICAVVTIILICKRKA